MAIPAALCNSYPLQDSKQEDTVSGFDKVVGSYAEALDGLEDGMTIIAGGFGLCGIQGAGPAAGGQANPQDDSVVRR